MKSIKGFEPKFWIACILTALCGLVILWIDSQTGWDDTAVTAGLIFISSLAAGLIYPRNQWLWAILIGIWIPLTGIIKSGDYFLLLVFAISLAGSYSGGLIRFAFRK